MAPPVIVAPIGQENTIQTFYAMTSSQSGNGDVSAGVLLAESSLPPGRTIYDEMQDSGCAKKIRGIFPPLVLPVSALAFEQARIDQREQAVTIPLKEAHGEIRSIWFHSNNISEALEIIHLLEAGKIGAVSILPFMHRPTTLYVFQGVTMEDIRDCQTERIIELLGKCTECEVFEWRSLNP
jgi:hypothetical protein